MDDYKKWTMFFMDMAKDKTFEVAKTVDSHSSMKDEKMDMKAKKLESVIHVNKVETTINVEKLDIGTQTENNSLHQHARLDSPAANINGVSPPKRIIHKEASNGLTPFASKRKKDQLSVRSKKKK
jgi:hypothetical protein